LPVDMRERNSVKAEAVLPPSCRAGICRSSLTISALIAWKLPDVPR
jgi:hypothetical protein